MRVADAVPSRSLVGLPLRSYSFSSLVPVYELPSPDNSSVSVSLNHPDTSPAVYNQPKRLRKTRRSPITFHEPMQMLPVSTGWLMFSHSVPFLVRPALRLPQSIQQGFVEGRWILNHGCVAQFCEFNQPPLRNQR